MKKLFYHSTFYCIISLVLVLMPLPNANAAQVSVNQPVRVDFTLPLLDPFTFPIRRLDFTVEFGPREVWSNLLNLNEGYEVILIDPITGSELGSSSYTNTQYGAILGCACTDIILDVNNQPVNTPNFNVIIRSLNGTFRLTKVIVQAYGVSGKSVTQGTYSAPVEIVGETDNECSEFGGSSIQLTADIGTRNASSIAWMIDGVVSGYTEIITPFLEVGEHLVQVDVVTDDGLTGSTTETIKVMDTIPPKIDTAFIDVKSGEAVNYTSNGRRIFPSYTVSDVCDSDPSVEAYIGTPTNYGDTLIVNKIVEGLILKSDTDSSKLVLSVTATDASGNQASKKEMIDITQ